MLREKPSTVLALSIAIVPLLLLIPIQHLFAAPAPPELVVNHETKECSEFWGGDECYFCRPPEGWESLGVTYEVECPAGYTLIDDLEIECWAATVAFCCTEGHSGIHGDCEDMVVHKRQKQCAFVDDIQTALLPKGWEGRPEGQSPDRWACPSNYEWVENPATGTGPTGQASAEDNGGGGLPCVSAALVAPVALGVWLSTNRQRRT